MSTVSLHSLIDLFVVVWLLFRIRRQLVKVSMGVPSAQADFQVTDIHSQLGTAIKNEWGFNRRRA